MSDGCIVIEGWERFQHYKDRWPPWIKTYTELLANDDYLNLSGNRRGILQGLWLAYAMSHGKLTDNTASLSRRLGLRVTRRDLVALNHAGFIHLTASNPLADRPQDASPRALARGREETETEEQTPEGSTLTENPSSSTSNEASYLEAEPRQRYDPVERPDFAAALQAGKRQGSDHHTNEDKPWWT